MLVALTCFVTSSFLKPTGGKHNTEHCYVVEVALAATLANITYLVIFIHAIFNMHFKILNAPSWQKTLWELRVWWLSKGKSQDMINWSVSWNPTHAKYRIKSLQT